MKTIFFETTYDAKEWEFVDIVVNTLKTFWVLFDGFTDGRRCELRRGAVDDKTIEQNLSNRCCDKCCLGIVVDGGDGTVNDG